ncbi:cytochrome c biogenesis protein ResB [Paludibacter sp.]
MANDKVKHAMWQYPWGYPESIAIVVGVAVVGFILQLTIGNFNFYLLTSPINYIFAIAIIILSALSALFFKRKIVQWFTGIPFSVSLLLALLILCIIMGLTPQVHQLQIRTSQNIFMQLGFDQMTHSWTFILIYFVTVVSLGSLIARRLRTFNIRDYGFYLNHLGLWTVLVAAGFGYADMERYIMHVSEGSTEWRVYDNDNNVKELPIAIQLNDFDMEEYPPKLTIIDRTTGEPQPAGKADYYQIDTKHPDGFLLDWHIDLEEYIHQAVRNSDSTYREVPMPGATPAIRIRAANQKTGEIKTGWVCGGNQAQLYMSLPLSDQHTIVMTQTEAKRFMSDVIIYTPDGSAQKAIIEVNSPAKIGNWAIYQYGYDNAAGRLSSYSSFELVYDPWKKYVYAGFLLIALGTIAMIWNGKAIRMKYKQKNESKKEEND